MTKLKDLKFGDCTLKAGVSGTTATLSDFGGTSGVGCVVDACGNTMLQLNCGTVWSVSHADCAGWAECAGCADWAYCTDCACWADCAECAGWAECANWAECACWADCADCACCADWACWADCAGWTCCAGCACWAYLAENVSVVEAGSTCSTYPTLQSAELSSLPTGAKVVYHT